MEKGAGTATGVATITQDVGTGRVLPHYVLVLVQWNLFPTLL